MFFRVLLTIFYHIFLKSGAKVRIIFKSANNLILFSRINRIFVPSYKE